PDPARPEISLAADRPAERGGQADPGRRHGADDGPAHQAATASTAGVRTTRRVATVVAPSVTPAARTATSGNSHGQVVGRDPGVLTIVYGTTAASDAPPPATIPVAAISAASMRAIDVTCPCVEPASRCKPNSRRRAAIDAASAFTTMIAAKTHTMPTTTR